MRPDDVINFKLCAWAENIEDGISLYLDFTIIKKKTEHSVVLLNL